MEHMPCPFCGESNNGPAEGSTGRWIAIECLSCGARSGEVRRARYYDGEQLSADIMAAYQKWDTRTPAPAGKPPEEAGR